MLRRAGGPKTTLCGGVRAHSCNRRTLQQLIRRRDQDQDWHWQAAVRPTGRLSRGDLALSSACAPAAANNFISFNSFPLFSQESTTFFEAITGRFLCPCCQTAPRQIVRPSDYGRERTQKHTAAPVGPGRARSNLFRNSFIAPRDSNNIIASYLIFVILHYLTL